MTENQKNRKSRAIKPSMWFEKEYFREKNRISDCLTVILKTSGCYWAKKSGCAMCGYSRDSIPGIKKKIEPGDPIMEDVYELSPVKKRELGIGELPTTLRDALDHLASDELMQKVLGSHIFDAFMSLKYDEWNQYCLYITPWEILKYMDI